MKARTSALATTGLGLALAAVAIRVHNAYRYPADWGFDSPFNWKYIYRTHIDWVLPPPHAGWSTGDPPLYFFAGAALMRAFPEHLVAIPLVLSALVGLAVAALAIALVWRVHPGDRFRAVMAGGLVLYLPAHVQMSAMVNEEMLATALVSVALFALVIGDRRSIAGAAAIGAAAGLAALTKLSGALVGVTAALTIAIDGLQRTGRTPALRSLAVLVGVAFLTGGWYYARNLVLYGYVQPFGLPAHRAMFEMPPGQRSVGDFVRIPAATFTDPQLLNPDLLHSVWGSTYATAWFDGHRHFLPRDSEAVTRLGTATLLLALLPTCAFAVGASRGVRRAARAPAGPDLPLLLMIGLTGLGYAVYAWRNPWFVTLKGTSLLGLCLPFAYYASETLCDWLRRSRALGVVLSIWLAALAVAVTLSCTFGLAFEKTEVSGLPWQSSELH